MCADAMEFVPRRTGRSILATSDVATRRMAVPDDRTRAGGRDPRRERSRPAVGSTLVSGEVIWDDPDGAYYHHYPSVELARSWLADAGFEIVEETEGPWDEGYAYHHVLSHA